MIEITRKNKIVLECESGDIVLIDNEAYMICNSKWNEYILISLEDGNRYTDNTISEINLNRDHVVQMIRDTIETSARIEFYKKGNYKLTLSI